ncbi:MAG: M23 family metallopeptidase [Bdellovibrionaceae bacterium]|nr:M23 family metallopeptidase [Bdellovibrionales bacterium]MCB9085187.1 M23 family metallopeptidase [Pseudobdellovibrionaceae bacterium]
MAPNVLNDGAMSVRRMRFLIFAVLWMLAQWSASAALRCRPAVAKPHIASTERVLHVVEAKNWWWGSKDSYFALVFNPSRPDQPLRVVEAKKREDLPRPGEADVAAFHSYLKANNLTILRSPLEGEAYVINGNKEHHHNNESGFGDFAWDLVKLDSRTKLSYRRSGRRNSDFVVWNKKVWSPVQGKVVEVVRNQPDNPAKLEGGEFTARQDGNYVGIHLGGNFYLYLLHFKRNSIPESVVVGSTINVGDYLGRVGNSGVSLVPHLHMSLYYFDKGTNRYWSVPGLFSRLGVKALSEESGEVRSDYVPSSGDLIFNPRPISEP